LRLKAPAIHRAVISRLELGGIQLELLTILFCTLVPVLAASAYYLADNKQ